MNGRPTLRRRMSVRFVVVLAITLAVPGALTGTAAALEPGVFVDPGSPAGKEYGVPLSDLRGAAAGHAPVGNESPPLFGIGIAPASASVAAGSAAPGGRLHRSRRAHPARGRRAAGVTPAAGVRAGGTGPGSASTVSGAGLAGLTRHGSSAPALILIEGLVVLGGLAVGAALVGARRRLG
jgi:hypothetical protein